MYPTTDFDRSVPSLKEMMGAKNAPNELNATRKGPKVPLLVRVFAIWKLDNEENYVLPQYSCKSSFTLIDLILFTKWATGKQILLAIRVVDIIFKQQGGSKL